MPAQRDTRSDAGTAARGADDGDADLAGRVEAMEHQLLRIQARQRALIHALARITGFASTEMERLTVD